MKDAYSFDIDNAGLDISYQKHYDAYCAIFRRCGLEFVAVDADSGAMGGSGSQEFMVYTDAGEDLIASSPSGYAANLEKATSKLASVEDLAATSGSPEEVHTPGFRTIDEVGAFLQTRPQHQMKTMAYMVEHPDTGSKEDTKQINTVGKTRGVVVFPARRPSAQRNETRCHRSRRTPPHDARGNRRHLSRARWLPGPHRPHGRAASAQTRRARRLRRRSRRPHQPHRRRQ